MGKVFERIDGVMIGVFLGFDDEGPLVVFAANPAEHALRARTLTALSAEMVGAEVALLFEDGDPLRPLIVGRVVEPARTHSPAEVIKDGKTVRITARERLELRCGSAAILMEKDGRITIRGSYVTSQASAVNRLRGGTIDLN